jgi:hypothetical protein
MNKRTTGVVRGYKGINNKHKLRVVKKTTACSLNNIPIFEKELPGMSPPFKN